MRTQKFGASIRKQVDKAILAKRTRYECPRCHKLKVKRNGTAKWNCRSCGAEFAGGAYSFKTEAGEIAARLSGEYSKE
jgi:large subunit ribosomal protein L37Ae